MRRTVVIGGGISGLSAALMTKLKFPKQDVILIEASSTLGGWIKSVRYKDGTIHELGPRTIRMQSPTVNSILNLINITNSESNLISISKSNSNFNSRYIYANQKLTKINPSLLSTELFSESFIVKLFKLGLKNYKNERNINDFRVDDYFRSRFGDDVADYLINPMIRGIYACDSRNLGMASTFPMLLKWEKSAPNLVLGYLKSQFNSDLSPLVNISKNLQQIQKESAVISFQGGLATLVDNTVNKMNEVEIDIITNEPVKNVNYRDEKFEVQLTSGSVIQTDKLICATPAYISGQILNGNYTEYLNAIKWNSIVVVVLEYLGAHLIVNKGFGHLIPSWELPTILGVVYDSCILPELDSKNEPTSRFTVMLGGSWISEIDHLSNDAYFELAQQVVKTQLNLTQPVKRFTVAKQINCVPEYQLMHPEVIRKLRNQTSHLPLQFCGNSYDGVSVSDCVQSGVNAAEYFNK